LSQYVLPKHFVSKYQAALRHNSDMTVRISVGCSALHSVRNVVNLSTADEFENFGLPRHFCLLYYANRTEFLVGTILCDRLCGLVVSPDYRYRGHGFDSRHYQIF
jgi:hypothetical protein